MHRPRLDGLQLHNLTFQRLPRHNEQFVRNHERLLCVTPTWAPWSVLPSSWSTIWYLSICFPFLKTFDAHGAIRRWAKRARARLNGSQRTTYPTAVIDAAGGCRGSPSFSNSDRLFRGGTASGGTRALRVVRGGSHFNSEGLRQLEAEGLVTTVPHRGPVVSTIGYEDAEEIYAVRALVEAYAGQQFAERGSPEEMSKLTEALLKCEAAANSEDPGQLLAAKREFYAVLEDGCGNHVVRQILRSLGNRVNLLRSRSMSQAGRVPNSIAEVRDIHDAIKARDGVRAAAACRYHVEMAAKSALSQLRRQAREMGSTPERA